MAGGEVRRPRILYLDAYDSFSNNIIALVKSSLNADVVSVHIDDKRFAEEAHFSRFAQLFDAIIAGPGPGTATKAQDVGLMRFLWTPAEENLVPVLGICLGFQSLSLAFGAAINRLKQPQHGMVTEVLHNGTSIFRDLESVRATQYHSLCVDIGHAIQRTRSVAHPRHLWEPTESCPMLLPLAWDCDNTENGAVLMGLKHAQKPFWGVQYHPESICTHAEGAKIVCNWWQDAVAWNHENRAHVVETWDDINFYVDGHVPASQGGEYGETSTGEQWNYPSPHQLGSLLKHGGDENFPERLSGDVGAITCGSGRLRVSDICSLLQVPVSECVVLESGLRKDLTTTGPGTGRYSIIGLFVPNETIRLHYFVRSRTLMIRNGHDMTCLRVRVDNIWEYLRLLMDQLKPASLNPHSESSAAPFWGGLMGFVSYEAGLDTIDVPASTDPSKERPDICFAFVTRSIVVDHSLKKLFVQSMRADDHAWLAETFMSIQRAVVEERPLKWTPDLSSWTRSDCRELLSSCDKGPPGQTRTAADSLLWHYVRDAKLIGPKEEEYCEKVEACLEAIRAGDSYEMCLTDQTQLEIPAAAPAVAVPWFLYQRLVAMNPAPFGAFIRIGKEGTGVNILSSSPERFLSWDRQGVCQSRPIKGTVKKTPRMTRAMAEQILSSPKERAENLMIVDLTRHQMHHAYGPGNVHVRQLMKVEEYETVYQLVSVVEGRPLESAEDRSDRNRMYPFPSSVVKDPTSNAKCLPTSTVLNVSSGSSGESSSSATPHGGHSPRIEEIQPTPSVAGIDVLAASLPPGSMTGAPKRRSCELLQSIERDRPRGIYSGIIGYLDVGGGGDFAVVIRTAVKWDDDQSRMDLTPSTPSSHDTQPSPPTKAFDKWTIGAGGAITAQSSPRAEWDEMLTKRDSTMRIFSSPNTLNSTASVTTKPKGPISPTSLVSMALNLAVQANNGNLSAAAVMSDECLTEVSNAILDVAQDTARAGGEGGDVDSPTDDGHDEALRRNGSLLGRFSAG